MAQAAVQREGSHRVRSPEAPVWKERLHDLEPMRDRVEAGQQLGSIHVGPRRGRNPEDDLRLDPGLN